MADSDREGYLELGFAAVWISLYMLFLVGAGVTNARRYKGIVVAGITTTRPY